jgi:predicted N-formylglutamate amidohydrolase
MAERGGAYLHDLGEPVALTRPNGRSPVVILCEHASSRIPDSLNHLGLAPEDRLKHIAWDLGALAVAECLSAYFDAPLVASTVSRLVYDCNRLPQAPDAIVTHSEGIPIPGNHGLSLAERDTRQRLIHQPFHEAAAALVAQRARPVLVTVHSFTPVFFGQAREVELGLLADGGDERLAQAMWEAAPAITGLRTQINAPYHPKDGMTYSARAHALPREALHVMFEVRNDLISTDAQVNALAPVLAQLLERGLLACSQV